MKRNNMSPSTESLFNIFKNTRTIDNWRELHKSGSMSHSASLDNIDEGAVVALYKADRMPEEPLFIHVKDQERGRYELRIGDEVYEAYPGSKFGLTCLEDLELALFGHAIEQGLIH